MPKIRIVNHNEDWPKEFIEIASEIRLVVSNNVLRIDHIGSTAVPGLAAKDIIDIQMTVRNLKSTVDISKLQSLAYELLPDISNDKFYNR